MHIRPKPWARPELEACGFFQAYPPDHRGQWQPLFKKSSPFILNWAAVKEPLLRRWAAAIQRSTIWPLT